MNGLHKQTSFSWKRGFFASQLEGLYHHNAPTKDKAQKYRNPMPEHHKNQKPDPTDFSYKISCTTAS